MLSASIGPKSFCFVFSQKVILYLFPAKLSLPQQQGYQKLAQCLFSLRHLPEKTFSKNLGEPNEGTSTVYVDILDLFGLPAE